MGALPVFWFRWELAGGLQHWGASAAAPAAERNKSDRSGNSYLHTAIDERFAKANGLCISKCTCYPANNQGASSSSFKASASRQ